MERCRLSTVKLTNNSRLQSGMYAVITFMLSPLSKYGLSNCLTHLGVSYVQVLSEAPLNVFAYIERRSESSLGDRIERFFLFTKLLVYAFFISYIFYNPY